MNIRKFVTVGLMAAVFIFLLKSTAPSVPVPLYQQFVSKI